MKAFELKKKIADGALSQYTNLYADVKLQAERFIAAIKEMGIEYESPNFNE